MVMAPLSLVVLVSLLLAASPLPPFLDLDLSALSPLPPLPAAGLGSLFLPMVLSIYAVVCVA